MKSAIKIVIAIIITLLVSSNIYFINEIDKYKTNDSYITSLVIISIENSTSKMIELVDIWEEIDDFEKVYKISEIDLEVSKAIQLSGVSSKYFSPLKYYRDALNELKLKVRDRDLEHQIEYAKDLELDFLLLSKFVSNNNIYEISKEELYLKWKEKSNSIRTAIIQQQK